jgi:hypothetical protein
MAQARTQRKSAFGLRFYPMIKQDPICDTIKTLVQDEGFDIRKDVMRLSYLTGVSPSTYRNLFDGVTRQPRNSTAEGTIKALGFKRVVVRDTEKKINRERAIEQGMEIAREKRERAARAAARLAKKANGHG